MSPRSHPLLLLALALFAACPDAARGLDYVEAHYTKYEYRIPMRDGKKLFTAVYVPKDESKRYPILLTRTPFSVRPYGVDQYRSDLGPSPLFAKSGYIFAYQDVRGRWMSEGKFVHMRPHNAAKKDKDIDESSDTWDTIDWLVKHVPNHNGRVGQWGGSYAGFYTAAGTIDAHPALKACSPQAPITDWFMGDDWHHNGAFFLPHKFNFMANFGQPRPKPTKKLERKFDPETPDGYDFFLRLGPLPNANGRYFNDGVGFWSKAMKHGVYDDFWKSRNLRPHLKNIKPAVMTVGGWFDAEDLFGTLETYRAIEATSAGRTNILVMGPWRHGGWGGRNDGESLGDVRFNDKTSVFYREQIELPFFEFHLKGVGKFKHPEAWVFETGTNQWRKHDAWPPKIARHKSLYLHAKGRLSWKAPDENGTEESHDEYPSDPAKPVPYFDKIVLRMNAEYMVADQRFAARRPDVLVYETDVLDEDATIAGPIQVDLHVSTTGTDSDWVVKLIDVYPDDYPDPKPNPAGVRMGGYQQLVRGDVMRGKFRNSFEKPEPFAPGKPAAVSFTMQDSYHTFRTGHRIMVQVQSSWFPLVDRNPQTFVDIYQAKESDFRKATQRVYRSREMPSRVSALVMPFADEPTVHRDLAYADTKNERQTLDVYVPAKGKNRPVVVWIHGGGWHSGDKKEVREKPRAFVEKGFVFVSINYRLLPEATIKQMAEDVAKAIRWIHDRARDYGGDPNAIFVMGHSAGAQLAALVCTDDSYLKAEKLSLSLLKGCVPVDGDSYDVAMQMKAVGEKRAAGIRIKFGAEKMRIDLSSVTHVAKGKHIPPFLILHVADHPETKGQSQRLVKALQEAGISAKTYPAEGKNHTTLNDDLGKPDDKPTQALFDFLDGVLKE